MANIFSLYGSIFIDNEKANKSIDETTKKGETAGSKVGATFGNIAKGAATVGTAIVGAATAVGGAAYSVASSVADTAGAIDDSAKKVGTSAEEYQKWTYAAKLGGMEAATIEKAMIKQQKAFADAKDGSKAMSEAYQRLGVDIKNIGNSGDAFNQVIAALADMEDETTRNALANDIFGKSYAELAPLLAEGSEGIEKMKAEAEALGGVMSNEAVAAGAEFGDTIDRLKTAGTGLFNSLGTTLIPIISEVANLIMANLPTIQGLFAQLAPIITQIITTLMPPLMELASTLLPILIDLIMQIIPPCMNIITAVLPVITQLLQMLLPPILQIVQMILPLLLSLIEPILPLLQPILALLQPLIDLLMAIITPLVEILNAILPPLIAVISKVIEIALVPLQGAFTVLAGILSGTVTAAFSHVQNIIDTAKGVMSGLIDFVKNVFTGNWQGAWEAVKNIFSSVFNGIKNAFKVPINWIIDGINSFIRGLNKLKIPDWVPGVGGKGFHIGTIPRLRVGIDYVPYDDFPALLHKGERVLTASEAKAQEKQQSAETSKTASPVSLEMNLNIENFNNQSDRDIKSLIDEIMILIEEYLRRKGLVWA